MLKMIIKIKPDLEKVNSMLHLIKCREESAHILDFKKFSTIVAEMYYEIIKELSSALILLDGFKSVGRNAHKDLVDFLSNYPILDIERALIDDLRIKRHGSFYEGKSINESYLEDKREKLLGIIKKLKVLIKDKLADKKRWLM